MHRMGSGYTSTMANNHVGPCSDGLLVIARPAQVGDSNPNENALSLSLDQLTISERFKGLSADRQAWPMRDDRIDAICGDGGLPDCGLVPLSELSYVTAYHARTSQHLPCDLLYCQPLASWDEAELRQSDDLSFLGYDYGYYLGVDTHFSAVHDDIIYGRYEQLQAYSRRLNGHLLLPSLELVQDVHHARTELIHLKAALECSQSFIPIAISVPVLERS